MFDHSPILPGRHADIRMSLDGYIVPALARVAPRPQYNYEFGKSRKSLRPIITEGV